MAGIFISYRRDDCAGHAGRLYDRLSEHFGTKRVFIDVDSIEPGVDFGERLEAAVGECGLLIALIGDEWLTIEDPSGRRRLEDPEDFVRLELAAGLARHGLRVIPVLVEDASMPRPGDLPDDLKPLAKRNALELSHARWQYDVGRLIEVAERIAGPPRRRRPQVEPRAPARVRRWLAGVRPPAPGKRARVAGGIGLVAGILGATAIILSTGGGDGDSSTVVVSLGEDSSPRRPTFAMGAVWVPVGGRENVSRVDPVRRRQALLKVRSADDPSSASAGAAGIWIADSGTNVVRRVDPDRRTLGTPIRVGAEPNDIAVGEGAVWTANCACDEELRSDDYSVSRVDPDRRVEERLEVPGRPLGIGVGGGNVWVTDEDNGAIWRLAPATGEVVGDEVSVGRDPVDVLVDPSGIWVAVEGDGEIAHVDPSTLRVDFRILVGPQPETLAVGGGFLWIADGEDGTVRRLALDGGRQAEIVRKVGAAASGVTYGEGRAWVTSQDAGTLTGVAP